MTVTHASCLIDEFAEHLARPADKQPSDQSLADGAAGIALLHVERARTLPVPWHTAHRWIRQAASGGVSGADHTGLYFGAPALAFLLYSAPAAFHAVYHPAWTTLHTHVTALANRRVDAASARMLRGELPGFAEYDIFYGLTGIGAYFLRSDPGAGALERILSYLVSLTHPSAGKGHRMPGWWVGHDPHRTYSSRFPGGHGNFGAAHGMTGPLMLLAQSLRRGISVDGQTEAILSLCAHLDRWRQEGAAGPWWPEHLTVSDVTTGRIHAPGPARPSWCYGTPGIARAGQLAGIALGDRGLRHFYEDALYRCLSDPVQLARVTDTSLCHGWAGIYQTAFRASCDAPGSQLSHLLGPLGEALTANARAGSPQGRGLLEGDAGCALALTTLAAGHSPTTGWDACLLID
ncbi:lanthionine synthetase C family protein [Streptomyces paludis]|uniref:Lanthionine synthetase n=1 Tax=Streptomyces paludis TaxID=2282738 RepID=A0A345HSZ7_9ACTN|nr:lanthionine synthetase C family protein [Streptomyces paludis]AXG79821.1 lanthionine synthetase [Streptomyces paludis]